MSVHMKKKMHNDRKLALKPTLLKHESLLKDGCRDACNVNKNDNVNIYLSINRSKASKTIFLYIEKIVITLCDKNLC